MKGGFNAIVNNKHLNTQCGVHGGFVSTVLDSVTVCADHTILWVGVANGTIDLNIKMLRPVPKDENLMQKETSIRIYEKNYRFNRWPSKNCLFRTIQFIKDN